MATWTGALSKPIGYTPQPTTTTLAGTAGIYQPVTTGTGTTPGYYGQSYTQTAGGEVDDALLQDYAAKYGPEAKQVVLDYFNNKDTYIQNHGLPGLENYMTNWWNSKQKSTASTPAETTTASTSAVQGANTTTTNAATNSQADALSNNVNEGENKAKQTMTVQSGSDMGGVNYTNAGGKSTTATTSSDDNVMPQESATPTNQKYNSWMQNASTFGTSDENEKRSPESSLKQPLTLTKTVYWRSRRKK